MKDQPIVMKTYDLLKEIIPILNNFPRSFKFSLAERLQNLISDCLELLIEAYYTSPREKKPILKKVNIKLEQCRFYLRLGLELGIYSTKTYAPLIHKVDEIGRMTGGWIKSLR
jgi:hypothetical protein